MTTATSRLRRLIGAWPLRRQILFAFLLVTLVMVVGGGLAAHQIVADYLTARFEDNSAGTLDFLGGAIVEPLLTRDVPQLESTVRQSFLRDRQILSMTIEDHNGRVLVHKARPDVVPQHLPFVASKAVRFDNRTLGTMSITWNTDEARAETRRDAYKFAGILLGALLLLAVVLTFAVDNLIISPLRRIHDYLVQVAQGRADRKLQRQPSLELNQLAQSANALYDHVEADQLRHKQLQREVEALASRVARLGQYTLLEKLGEGGMGEVWKAQHALLRRPTAVKLLNQRMLGPEALLRFQREVQLTSSLTHPNTIAVFDFGQTDKGVFYYVMEYLEGWNLEQLVARHGALPPGRVIHILRQVCGSLREAHERGLIHRDIKPANIFLCQRGGLYDFVKVLDFGLVAEVRSDGEQEQSLARSIAGTPAYMPPEVIRGDNTLTPGADLYSLAAVGYFLLTGLELFSHTKLQQLLQAHLTELVVSPSVRLGKPVPVTLEKLLLAALAKHPQGRPPSAAAFLQALDQCEATGIWREEDARHWWDLHSVHASGQPVAVLPNEAIEQETEQRQSITVDFVQRSIIRPPLSQTQQFIPPSPVPK